jgi:hypothetical protein
MKAVSTAHAWPPVVAGGALVLIARGARDGILMKNAIAF